MKKLSDITVLVTASGVQFMPGLSKCLKENGERKIKLVGVDIKNDATIKQMVDVFYQVPRVDDESYIDKIYEICIKENVDIIIPFMSAELPLFIKNRDKFNKKGIIVSVSEGNSVSIANNKFKLYEFMKKNDIPVCKFCAVRSLKELDRAFKYLGYPKKAICVKATESSGSRGIRIVDPSKSRFDILFNEKPNSFFISYEELKEILSEKDNFPEMMAMEYLPGEEFSVDLLADKGKVLYICGRESNQILASIPQESTLFKNETAYEICKKIVEKLKIDGNADFDFKYDENGKPVLMEINPRIAATMLIFKEGGLNLPYLRVKQLLGEELPEVEVKYGIRMKRRYLEMFDKGE